MRGQGSARARLRSDREPQKPPLGPASTVATDQRLQPRAVSVGGLRPPDVVALHRSNGNGEVTALLSGLTGIMRQPLGGVVGADAEFNPDSIVNDLRRAINQSEIRPITNEEARSGRFGSPYSFDLIIARVRSVDAGAVIRALDNLTAAQAGTIETLYATREGRWNALRKDLFGPGESGYPSDLKQDQSDRIAALLKGTRPDLKPSAGPSEATAGRLEADAVELHELLADDLDEAKRERVMALHRRPLSEIGGIDGAVHEAVPARAGCRARPEAGRASARPSPCAERRKLGLGRRLRDRGQAAGAARNGASSGPASVRTCRPGSHRRVLLDVPVCP